MKRAVLFLTAVIMIAAALSGCRVSEQPAGLRDESAPIKADTETAETKTQEEARVVELLVNSPFFADLNRDGESREVLLSDAGEQMKLLVGTGDSSAEFFLVDTSIGYLVNAYYVQSFDGYPFFVASYDDCSDDYVAKVLVFSDGEIKEIFKTPLYVDWIDEFGFEAYGFLQSVGTWAVRTHAYFVQDGIEWRGVYELDQNAPTYQKVHTAMELPVQLIVNDTYIQTSLPTGTILGFTKTDGESYMDFVLEDGTQGKLGFSWSEDWIEVIDNIPIYEYFEDLPQFG